MYPSGDGTKASQPRRSTASGRAAAGAGARVRSSLGRRGRPARYLVHQLDDALDQPGKPVERGQDDRRRRLFSTTPGSHHAPDPRIRSLRGRARTLPRLQRHEDVPRRALPPARARPGGAGRDLDRRPPPATRHAAATARTTRAVSRTTVRAAPRVRRGCEELSVGAVERRGAARPRARARPRFRARRGLGVLEHGLPARAPDRRRSGARRLRRGARARAPRPAGTGGHVARARARRPGRLVPGWSSEVGDGRQDVRGRYHPCWVGHRTLASTGADQRRFWTALACGRAVRPRAADRIGRDRLRRSGVRTAELRARGDDRSRLAAAC